LSLSSVSLANKIGPVPILDGEEIQFPILTWEGIIIVIVFLIIFLTVIIMKRNKK